MARLEDLRPNAAVHGVLPDALVTVVNVQWFGSEALELTYKDPQSRVANLLLYRHDESRIDIVEQGLQVLELHDDVTLTAERKGELRRCRSLVELEPDLPFGTVLEGS